MVTLPRATIRNYARQALLARTAQIVATRAWAAVDTANISTSWTTALRTTVVPTVTLVQRAAATQGARYVDQALAEQGLDLAEEWAVDTTALAGVTTAGYPLDRLLYLPAIQTKQLLTLGIPLGIAMARAGRWLEGAAGGVALDAGRDAVGLKITAKPACGYVRMVSAGACDRCTILAGKVFRNNDGFERHPRCYCQHVPTNVTSAAEAYAQGLIDNPDDVFNSLTREEQDRRFGKANAEAIRQGADMNQIVNANAGRVRVVDEATGKRTFTNFTVEGTTQRGWASHTLAPGQKRAMPRLLQQWAGGDNDTYRALLAEHGYLSPTTKEQFAALSTHDRPTIKAAFAGGGGGKPPGSRNIGGAMDDDRYPSWAGWSPPVRPSEIEVFDRNDALILLDGEESLENLTARARANGRSIQEEAGHGYHRFGLGIKSSEFPPGWDAEDVEQWVHSIVYSPEWGEPGFRDGFLLYGTPLGVGGRVVVRNYGRWMVTTAIPSATR